MMTHWQTLFFVILSNFLFYSNRMDAAMITQETIKRQNDATRIFKLKNNIPVLYRHVENSDIFQINVIFTHGLKDSPAGKKVLGDWMFSTLPLASKKYPKEKVFSISEKNALKIGCGASIDVSACTLGAINDQLDEALPLFASLILEPAFNNEDLNFTKERIIADLRGAAQDPSSYVNEIVNKVFYPTGHPYESSSEAKLAEMGKLTKKDITDLFGEVLDSSRMHIVVVGSIGEKVVQAKLDKLFGSIKDKKGAVVKVEAPKFSKDNFYAFEERKIPTAYIRMKFDAPNFKDSKRIPMVLLMEILDQKLHLEVRTKRSLSYAVHSHYIQNQMGVGVMSASTSKPQETLETMKAVVESLKNEKIPEKELEKYKTVFVTEYFLAQETHSSLADALSSHFVTFGRVDEFYEIPLKLGKVTSADIQELAKAYFNNYRFGVIYDRSLFDDKWVQNFPTK